MNKLFVLGISLLLLSCNSGNESTTEAVVANTEKAEEAVQEISAPAIKKYGIKSGIVTYENVIKAGDFEFKSKNIVYFDDYGMKECQETYEDETLKEVFFSDGQYLYSTIPSQKITYKRGQAYRGVAYKVDFNEISEEDKKSGEAVKIENMNILGKDCEAYTYKGMTYAGHQGISFLTSGSSSTVTAVKFEENVEIPAEKFKAPEGYELKEM